MLKYLLMKDFGTSKYIITKVYGTWRVENIKGLYEKEVPWIEVPRELVEWEFTNWLVDFKEYELTKQEGKEVFNSYCDMMFDEEHTELYLNEND